MLRFTTHYKDTNQETGDFDTILLQIYWSTRITKIAKIESSLTKLLQK